jgi:hypothetical protein
MSVLKISSKSIDPTISTGSVAQKDLLKWGHISVVFYKLHDIISVEIAGYSSQSFYRVNATTPKHFELNNLFVENYINKCQNPNRLKIDLGIN